MNDTTCIVFLCNQNYFYKFIQTCEQLINQGKYKGDICLVIGDDLKNHGLLNDNLITNNNIIVKHFPDINFNTDFLEYSKNINRPPHWFQKIFQYHKLHLFQTFFKKWNYIFYIDCGITIFSDINPILNLKKPNKLLAHSDSYPTYEWKLHNQFFKDNFFENMNELYNMNIDYPQTTIMLYDTNIIENDTFNNLYNLLLKYPNSITNDQGIIALYFTNIKPYFEQILTGDNESNYYDYLRRENTKYIMLKMV